MKKNFLISLTFMISILALTGVACSGQPPVSETSSPTPHPLGAAATNPIITDLAIGTWDSEKYALKEKAAFVTSEDLYYVLLAKNLPENSQVVVDFFDTHGNSVYHHAYTRSENNPDMPQTILLHWSLNNATPGAYTINAAILDSQGAMVGDKVNKNFSVTKL